MVHVNIGKVRMVVNSNIAVTDHLTLDEMILHYAALACRVKCLCSKSCHVWRRKECLINVDIMRNA